ncbi:hypothetical protein EMCRGX_G029667 [Ephydatia muelleri]
MKRFSAPSQPDPPAASQITYNSVQLSWAAAPNGKTRHADRLKYNLQECDKTNEFRTVYIGYAERHIASGLSPSTQYKYRLNASDKVGTSPWSDVITVCTACVPKSCEQLHGAVQKGDHELIRGILQMCPHYVDVPNIYGSSPLMCASQLGKTSIVELLLQHGADVHTMYSLMEACYHGNVDSAIALVVGGASWLTTDHSGMSSLHWAVDGDHIDMVLHILDQGVPADYTTSTTLCGWTPLMRTAMLSGNTQVAQVLIQHGANLNLTDADGKTALMMASLGGFHDLAQLLLQHGADLCAKSKYGKNALDFARSFSRQAGCS